MNIPFDWRQQLRESYPKRKGHQNWQQCGERIARHLKNGESWDEMLIGAKNYRKLCAEENTEPCYISQATTFYGPKMLWTEYQEMDDCSNAPSLDDKAQDVGLTRADGESDEHLSGRIGIAMTRKAYAI